MPTTNDRCCRTVYRGHGIAAEHAVEIVTHDARSRGAPPDVVPVTTIMTRELACARPDLDIATVVSLVIERHVGCLPVVDDHGVPIGIITKFDLVEQIDAAMRGAGCGRPLPVDLRAETANDVMMPIAFTLDHHASVAHAAELMISEETHHVLVVDDTGALVGIVSAKDLVGWVVNHDCSAPRVDTNHAPQAQPQEDVASHCSR